MIGKVVGRYRIESELGRGGMGVVYRATQVTLNRTVAVKMLPDHLAASEEYLSRFRREAETLARLQHPNIVHIYDVEEAEGSHFIIMEYVDGPSLTQMLRQEGRLDPKRARDITHALADALTAAHRQGIIHRDIKPDNILFSDGRPKLTDFGIAHMRDSNVRTQTGLMLGTPYYMSPEQAGGKPVTAASDIYSLGIVFYEMLTGRVPFDADTPVAVALMHLKENHPPLGSIAPDLPPDLARVVDRALAKDPGQRFKSGKELQRALAAIELGAGSGAGVARAGGGAPCSGCGTAIDPEFLACPSCGRAVREACSGCGQLYAATQTICPNCGIPRAAREPSTVESSPGAGRPGREGLAAGLAGLREAGKAFAGAAADVAQRSADVAAGVAQRSADAADRAMDAAGRKVEASQGPARLAERIRRLGPAVRRALPGRLASLPMPMIAGIGLVGLALLLALLQSVLGGQETGRIGSTLDPGGELGEIAAGPPPGSTGGSSGTQPLGGGTRRGPTRITRIAPARQDGANPGAGTANTGAGAANTDAGAANADAGAANADAGAAAGDLQGGQGREGTQAGANRAEDREPVGRTGDARTGDAEARRTDPTPPPEAGVNDRETRNVEPDPPVFDEAAARRQIAEIIERQRRATETGNLPLFLRDLAPELHQEESEGFLEVHAAVDAVRSRIGEVIIEFEDPYTALVDLMVKVDVQLRGQSRWTTAYDDWVTWEVSRMDNRWVITDVG